MSQPLLSILIPTVVGREKELDNLIFNVIKSQCDFEIGLKGGYNRDCQPVEVFWYTDNKEMTVGEKRNILYGWANGKYSFMPDDDDSISPNFIEAILQRIELNPDCITYFEHVDIDGDVSFSNHSIKYTGWHDNPEWPIGFKYARTPYFKDVIKTEIARSIEVPALRWNEDEQFANALKPHLKTEEHIDDFMYFYKHISSNPIERYGLDRD